MVSYIYISKLTSINQIQAYELYLPALQHGFFKHTDNSQGRQLTITLNKDRGMMGSQII